MGIMGIMLIAHCLWFYLKAKMIIYGVENIALQWFEDCWTELI